MVKQGTIFENKLLMINILSFVALIIAISSAFFFYNQYRKSAGDKQTAVSDVEKTALAVGKLMDLPEEAPTLATVSDAEKLKGQPFFQKAANGDKVLIFKSARKAILYRPFTNKIIEVGPIQIDEPTVAGTATKSAQIISPTVVISPATEASPTAVPTTISLISVAVFNGTKTAGLSRKTANTLLQEFKNIKIGTVGNAKGDYTKTVIVDVSQKNKSLAESIAKFVNGQVGSMPKNEATPAADILVLVGSAF